MNIEMILGNVFSSFAQSLAVSIILFKQINNVSKIDKTKFMIGMWVCCFVSSLVVPNQLRLVISILIVSLLLYIVLKINDKKVILYSFCSELILALSEIIISLFLVLFGVKSTDIVNNIYWNVFTNILISLFSVILVMMPFVGKLFDMLKKLFDKNKKLVNYLIVFLVMIYIIVSKNGREFMLESNYYINIAFIIGIMVIMSIIIKSESKAEQLKEMNEQMVNHVTKYEKIITDQGKANHEFKNQLMVIKGYAQMNSPKLLEYLDSVIEDSKKTHSSYFISQLNKFPAGGIKGLLYYKLSMMDDENIKHELNVESGVKIRLDTLGTESYKNITKMLGVLFDNAIDAAKKSKEKKIIIDVVKKTNSVTFSIYNTYKGKIEIDKIGTGFTTKGSGHGYGLRLVKDIIESNDIFKIENMLEDEYYVTRLTIKTRNIIKRKQTKKTQIKKQK